MKQLIIIIIIIASLAACSPDDATPTAPASGDIDLTGYSLVRAGMLVGQAGHTASGHASLYTKDGAYALVFDPFESQNGPDLKVYLSKDAAASQYIRLGSLKSTTGRQSYAIPMGTDISQYTFAHVWCEKFTVEFARAPLNP